MGSLERRVEALERLLEQTPDPDGVPDPVEEERAAIIAEIRRLTPKEDPPTGRRKELIDELAEHVRQRTAEGRGGRWGA